jgi:hypothetical protein
MKTKSKAFLPFLFLIFLLVNSCQKQTIEKDTEIVSASDNALATSTSNDMISISDEAGKNKLVSSFKIAESYAILSTCAQLQFDTVNHLNPDSILVNFGTNDCLCLDGRNRRGSILIIYTGKYKDSLTVITITPQNYFVEDNAIEGSKSITNLGHNASGHLVYSFSDQLKITKPNGSKVSWNCQRQREWVFGENTPYYWPDDVYHLTGSSSGVASNGNSFSSEITTPLVRIMQLGCRKHFVSGVITLKPLAKPERILDYGSGVCDNLATVTINGVTQTITLP